MTKNIKSMMARYPRLTKGVSVAVLIFIGLVLLSFLMQLFRMQGLVRSPFGNMAMHVTSQSMPEMDGYGGGMMGYATDDVYEETSLSVRNVMGGNIMPPMPSMPPSGNTAEEFEVTQYNATFEVRSSERVCDSVLALKTRDDVIFENSNTHDSGCDYSFKVEKESVPGVLAILESLDPKHLNENTYTIKRQVDDYTSQVEILEERLAVIDASLQSAISQYDSIARIATNAQDAEALAKIIDSKLNLIDRLTRERLNAASELERIDRALSDQLDRLLYVPFHVSVYENKYIDGEGLIDAWKRGVQNFVRDLNGLVMQITLGLVTFVLIVAVYVLYVLVLVVLVKYGWRFVKRIWQK